MTTCLLKVYGLVVMLYAVVKANVVVKTNNGSQDVTYFYDQAAAFGPSIPDKGITGYIYNVHPFNACRPVDPPPDNSSVWIALIARDNCSFVEKIRNVQRWSVAAIVYNHHDDNTLTRMHGVATDIKIPSVFIGWSDGIALSRNYCYNCTSVEPGKGAYQVTIDTDERPYYINPVFFVLFATVVGLCLTIMIVFLVVKWCRDFRRKRRSRLSSKHLKKIPVKKFKKGDEYDVCAICLDDYEEGEKLRLLPCSHVYHTKCIDPWLTKNKRSCPICKRKVIPGDDPDSDSETSDGDEDTPSERTPLLAGGSGGSGERRSTFDNSGLPETARNPHVSHVNEGGSHTSSDDSDLSDSEIGAVGGIRHVNLAKDNPLLSLPKSSNHNGADSKLTNQNERLEASATHSIEETAVIETSHGEDNSGFEVKDETDRSEDEPEFHVPETDVVFSESSKKDEKKSNGVI
ncbi:E3 ubiquitin-protein ligase RNF13-like isoform X3 [Mercenaria mercenaria]|uniref:E3 ubiquitin-protein ligase RNF13-like isoform X3 n=1 Tax=Mercenaria mercenaria TaxID=6596 RepID=UPI00234E4783|nr:E3 ubiquitin-protein ligase RNF13-like isoform X3 [Mercenaria mercenaria]